MLYRKFETRVREYLQNKPNKILLVNGARQIGKSYIIRYVGMELFPNYIEINLKEDKEGDAIFEKVRNTDDFYVQIGILYGDKIGTKSDTLIFLDEIQAYPHLFTMLKFLNQESKYTYIASGSQLGIALAETPSVPIGSIAIEQMFPLDFEEFLWALGASKSSTDEIRSAVKNRKPINDSLHSYLMKAFRYYLITGGMPEAVNVFVESRNITKIRETQRNIINLYKIDVSQYDAERKLKIRNIYDLIPSALENKKKRIVFRNIENRKGKQYEDYVDEFDYLTASGIAIEVKAISNPKFPLKESERKNLLKLYMNDVGLLTSILYETNANAILNDELSINLGTVYESVVAQELHAHGYELYYYDNKKNGEVDYLIDDFNNLSILPIEVKSGKDYTIHSALDKFLTNDEYSVNNAIVLSNVSEAKTDGKIEYLPVYYIMFIEKETGTDNILPSLEFPQIKTE